MKADEADLEAISSIANEVLVGTGHSMMIEGWVVWDPTHPYKFAHMERSSPNRGVIHRARNSGGWCHVPDLTIFDRNAFDILVAPDRGVEIYRAINPIRLIVEVDGGVHNRKMSKTVMRNNHYREANIHYIAVNKLDCEESGIDWKDAIRKEIRRVAY